MTWNVEFDAGAKKELEKLDRQVAGRIIKFLATRVTKLDNPRSIGQALKGSELGEFWKYRVGDYRIICEIQDRKLVVLVLRIGNRREVYR